MLSHQLHIAAILGSAMHAKLNQMLFKVSKAGKHFSDWVFFFFFFYIFVNECLHNKDVVCSLFSKEKSNLTLRVVAATQIQFNYLIEAAVK